MVAGADSGPGGQVRGGGEHAHVRAGLGDDNVSGQDADPGDGADQVAEPAKGLHDGLDPRGQLGDRRGVLVDQVQVDAHQERMMVGEPAGQRLGEGGDLDP